MYKEKSKIIEQIQSYHRQVAKLYLDIYEKIEDKELKTLIFELCEHEISREKYLEKHKKIAMVMNCYLEFPCDKLSNQISECFRDIRTGSDLTMDEIIRLEMHFDNCLIKLYNILATEDSMSESIANIFYYMLKKTRKEEATLTHMLFNSKSNLRLKLPV